MGTLLTGTLSPVSMLSLTIASPESSRISAGNMESDGEERLTMSPGTSVLESRIAPVKVITWRQTSKESDLQPFLVLTRISHENLDISRIRAMV